MGFRCPLCHKDFNRDIKKWEEHCKLEHNGLGQKYVEVLKDIAEKKDKEIKKNDKRKSN